MRKLKLAFLPLWALPSLLIACGGAYEGQVVINEVSAYSSSVDWFELYNPTDAAIDLSTWSFSDDMVKQKNKSFFQEGTVIEPKSYLLVHLSGAWPGFKLGKEEELAIYGPRGTLVDSVRWSLKDSVEGKSYGRFPSETGDFQVLSPTKGQANKE